MFLRKRGRPYYANENGDQYLKGQIVSAIENLHLVSSIKQDGVEQSSLKF